MGTTFHSDWWKRLDEFGLAILFTSIVLSPLYLGWTGMTVVAWFFYVMFAVFAILTWYCVLTFVCEISFSPNQLMCRSLVGRTVIQRGQIKDIQIGVSGKSSSVVISLIPRGNRTILLKSFSPSLGVVFQEWKDAEPAIQPSVPAIQEYRMQGISRLLLVIGLLVGGLGAFVGIERSDTYTFGFAIFVGGLIVLLAIGGLRSFARLSPDAIIVNRFGFRKKVMWQDITSINLQTYRSNPNVNEVLELRAGESKLWFGAGYDDFPLLRDAILARVDPAKVTDSRARR